MGMIRFEDWKQSSLKSRAEPNKLLSLFFLWIPPHFSAWNKYSTEKGVCVSVIKREIPEFPCDLSSYYAGRSFFPKDKSWLSPRPREALWKFYHKHSHPPGSLTDKEQIGSSSQKSSSLCESVLSFCFGLWASGDLSRILVVYRECLSMKQTRNNRRSTHIQCTWGLDWINTLMCCVERLETSIPHLRRLRISSTDAVTVISPRIRSRVAKDLPSWLPWPLQRAVTCKEKAWEKTTWLTERRDRVNSFSYICPWLEPYAIVGFQSFVLMDLCYWKWSGLFVWCYVRVSEEAYWIRNLYNARMYSQFQESVCV